MDNPSVVGTVVVVQVAVGNLPLGKVVALVVDIEAASLVAVPDKVVVDIHLEGTVVDRLAVAVGNTVVVVVKHPLHDSTATSDHSTPVVVDNPLEDSHLVGIVAASQVVGNAVVDK